MITFAVFINILGQQIYINPAQVVAVLPATGCAKGYSTTVKTLFGDICVVETPYTVAMKLSK